MNDAPPRASVSDAKQLYRRVLCQACGATTAHRHEGDYIWACPCGARFRQNPWVSEGHELIEPPIYLGKGTGHARRVRIV